MPLCFSRWSDSSAANWLFYRRTWTRKPAGIVLNIIERKECRRGGAVKGPIGGAARVVLKSSLQLRQAVRTHRVSFKQLQGCT